MLDIAIHAISSSKLNNTKDPSKCRPITMPSLINRLFYRILDKRLQIL